MQRGESGVQSWSGVEHAHVGRDRSRLQPAGGEFLGGYRDRLRVYRTCVFPGKQDQSDVPYETQAEFAIRLKNAGYTAMKIRAWRPTPMDDVEACRVIKKAVGPDFALMYDRTAVRPGWVWDYPNSSPGRARIGTRRGALAGRTVRRLRPARSGPAGRGSRHPDHRRRTRQQHLSCSLRYLTNKTYDIVQPDARICGGIWIARKIGVLAESFGVPCISTRHRRAILAGYIQAGCAMPNCEFQEMIGGPELAGRRVGARS